MREEILGKIINHMLLEMLMKSIDTINRINTHHKNEDSSYEEDDDVPMDGEERL